MATGIIKKRIVCPKCNETTEARLHTSINVTNQKDLREKTMNESLFKWKCSSCGYIARLTYPVLYNDMKNRFMIYLIPRIDHFQLADKELEENFKNLKHINKRIVPDFNTFKEKIFIFESGLDDMAIELTKLAISKIVAKKHHLKDVKEGYLSMYNTENNTMGFTFFIGEEKQPYVQSARLEIYGKSVSVVNELAVKDKKLKGFIRIDREWAENILYRYKRGRQVAKMNRF
ncbi:MAG: CpXC domain-containing protein [Ruminococcus sp.]|nr:CpXC domain-containing protein [Ruminococcus sp.]